MRPWCRRRCATCRSSRAFRGFRPRSRSVISGSCRPQTVRTSRRSSNPSGARSESTSAHGMRRRAASSRGRSSQRRFSPGQRRGSPAPRPKFLSKGVWWRSRTMRPSPFFIPPTSTVSNRWAHACASSRLSPTSPCRPGPPRFSCRAVTPSYTPSSCPRPTDSTTPFVRPTPRTFRSSPNAAA